MKRPLFRLSIWIIISSISVHTEGQRIFVNTIDSVYELTGGAGTCSYINLGSFCEQSFGGTIFSSALHKDTLYFLSANSNNLYRAKLGVPGSCTFLTNFPVTAPFPGNTSLNALTVDKNGLLYAVDVESYDLYRYNPYTGQKKLLGKVPRRPGGDLVFFEDKLLLSAWPDGIYEVNIDNPSASSLYMSTGSYLFYGLISFPFDCHKNKVYGFSPWGTSTQLVELDLETKTIGGVVCTFPFIIFDGASMVENGNTIGINIDSIVIAGPCSASATTGDAQIISYSAAAGPLTYTLDNSIVNNDGIFTNLSLGTHQVRITNQRGCVKDSSFVIARGLSPTVQLTTTHPESCSLQDGTITIQAFSNYQPITFSLNNAPAQISNQFTNLGSGKFNITIRDGGGCRIDTSTILNYQQRPGYLSGITVLPTFCEGRSGSITIGIIGDPAGISASLNNGPAQSSLHFNNLDAGQFLLSIFNATNCRYDTIVNIVKHVSNDPTIRMVTTDQFCFDNNGKVLMNVQGDGAPFAFQINNAPFSNTNQFDGLAPGKYPVRIRNSHYCYWDTAVEVMPYPKHPANFSLHKTDPTCKELNSGLITIDITGNEMPYYLQWNDQVYSSGTPLRASPGTFRIPILNKEHCAVDSADVSLQLIVEPECDRVMMPNAFSPNGDGRNDLFKPLHGPYIKKVVFIVYNRYGQVVFRNSDRNPGWDGKLNGHLQDPGTYIWTISFENYQGVKRSMKGLAVLVR